MDGLKATATLNRDQVIAPIDERIYGSFVEHLGRCVYGGIFEPGHPTADEDGLRQDVLALVQDLCVPIVRYPGGNFVSSFRWEDSVGPVSQRPTRLDLAWRTLEPNRFGLNEFMRWCKRAEAQPMMAVNLGTRGIEAAMDLLEYCNHPGGSYWSDLRAAHGAKAPHNVRVWCLGNEMDGPWQVGQKTPGEYGRLASETGKAMKLFDPTLELVSCGSSAPQMTTFPEWEYTTLDHTYEVADYISLHQYFDNYDDNFADYLSKTLLLDSFIETVSAVCNTVKAKKRGKKDIYISFDEWNVWFHSKKADDELMASKPWNFAPSLLEDVYTMEDALVAGSILISFLNHADRVKIACLAQLVNVIAPIMTETGGGVCRQTIYYPFLHASLYGRGTALALAIDSPKYDSRHFCDVPTLAGTAVLAEDESSLTLFAVNRSEHQPVAFSCRLDGLEGFAVQEALQLCNPNRKAVNTVAKPNTVMPAANKTAVGRDGVVEGVFPPASWNVIRLARV